MSNDFRIKKTKLKLNKCTKSPVTSAERMQLSLRKTNNILELSIYCVDFVQLIMENVFNEVKK